MGFERTLSVVQKLIGIFQPVPVRPVISLFCGYFAGSPRALCPLRTSLYQYGCSTFSGREDSTVECCSEGRSSANRAYMGVKRDRPVEKVVRPGRSPTSRPLEASS
jgi:hypothetical protein